MSGRIQSKQNSRPVANADRRGATTVEFALVVPLILTLFLGAVEITRLNFLRHTAANAAYEGARAAIVPGGTVQEAVTAATNILTMVGAGQGVNVNAVLNATSVQVTVTVPVNRNSWGVGRFSNGFNIVQACILQREIN
ncbi:MAG: pilus assembly protein [Pirellulaceae bacterium]|nr:pilus assembly protein [Pirellulaceae bacterium]